LEEATKDADCVVIATDHPESGQMDLDDLRKIMATNPIIVDATRSLDSRESSETESAYYGLGMMN